MVKSGAWFFHPGAILPPSSSRECQKMQKTSKRLELQTFLESSHNEHFFKAKLSHFLKYSIQQEPINLVSNFKLFLFSEIFIKIYSNLEFFFTSNYGDTIKIDLLGYKEYLVIKSS